ncbi:MAG: hypothetical protein WDW38_001490 [Sanguina aurantia]
MLIDKILKAQASSTEEVGEVAATEDAQPVQAVASKDQPLDDTTTAAAGGSHTVGTIDRPPAGVTPEAAAAAESEPQPQAPTATAADANSPAPESDVTTITPPVEPQAAAPVASAPATHTPAPQAAQQAAATAAAAATYGQEMASTPKLPTHIVIVTVVDDARFPKRLLDAGALGYLTKGCSADELVSAVRQVATGRRYLAPAVAQQLALATLDGSTSPFDVLSSRELEVAMMLVRGKPLTVIGEKLNLSPKTVSTYKQRLMEKLRVDHVLSLAHLMTVHGLLDSTNHQVGG